MDGDIKYKIENFARDLKHERVGESYIIVQRTADILRQLVAQTRWSNAGELISIIKQQTKALIIAQPSETTIGNVVRRVLKLIREEYLEGKPDEGNQQESLQKLFSLEGDHVDYTTPRANLKASILESINEYISELENSIDNIASQALNHIHTFEIIMTAGYCKTVETFLRNAAKKRKFQVIVVETSPLYQGQQLALCLAKQDIETTVITDSAIFAVMSRVNKVIIGTNAVLADGSLKAFNGAHTMALAAKYHSVPLLVCAAMYRLSPQYLRTNDQHSFNKFVSPENVLSFSEGKVLSKVMVYNPSYDHVPADLVTLYITSSGGNAPSYIYRLLSELYHYDDKDI